MNCLSCCFINLEDNFIIVSFFLLWKVWEFLSYGHLVDNGIAAWLICYLLLKKYLRTEILMFLVHYPRRNLKS